MEWISVKDRLPDDLQEVIVTFVNHLPEYYYLHIKDKPLTGVCVYYRENWYWYSVETADILAEYGRRDADEMDENIEITHWMPFPEPAKGE